MIRIDLFFLLYTFKAKVHAIYMVFRKSCVETRTMKGLCLCIIEPLQKLRAGLGSCHTGLCPQLLYITDRSKAIILLWF